MSDVVKPPENEYWFSN